MVKILSDAADGLLRVVRHGFGTTQAPTHRGIFRLIRDTDENGFESHARYLFDGSPA